MREYKLTSTQPIHDIDSFFWSSFDLLRQMHATLQSFLIKALLYLRVQYIKVNQATGQVIETVVIHFPSKAADDMTHLETWLQRHLACLLQQIEAFHQRDSGLEFDKVLDADIKVLLAENRAGRGHFTLPPALKSKKAVVNVDTETDCFKYAVLSMLHYQDVHSNRQRVSQYHDWKDELSFEGIDNAECMSFKDIAKFEALNNIKIIIHLWEKGALQGVRYNKTSSQYERVINLLLVYQESSAHTGITVAFPVSSVCIAIPKATVTHSKFATAACACSYPSTPMRDTMTCVCVTKFKWRNSHVTCTLSTKSWAMS